MAAIPSIINATNEMAIPVSCLSLRLGTGSPMFAVLSLAALKNAVGDAGPARIGFYSGLKPRVAHPDGPQTIERPSSGVRHGWLRHLAAVIGIAAGGFEMTIEAGRST